MTTQAELAANAILALDIETKRDWANEVHRIQEEKRAKARIEAERSGQYDVTVLVTADQARKQIGNGFAGFPPTVWDNPRQCAVLAEFWHAEANRRRWDDPGLDVASLKPPTVCQLQAAPQLSRAVLEACEKTALLRWRIGQLKGQAEREWAEFHARCDAEEAGASDEDRLWDEFSAHEEQQRKLRFEAWKADRGPVLIRR